MAALKDLYTGLSKLRGLNFGELRHLARALQAGGLLPRAGRRQRMRPPQVTAEDCATFLIGIGVSRNSGSRVPAELKRRVRKFKKLVHVRSDGTTSTLFEDMVGTIESYRETAWVTDKSPRWNINTVIFVIADRTPEVRVQRQHSHETDSSGHPVSNVEVYFTERRSKADVTIAPLTELEFCADAFVMPTGVFFELRRLLGPLEPEKGAG